jgi:gas vesicle protein
LLSIVLPEKLDELKGTEEKYCKDLTICQTKSEEIKDSETKCDSLVDETIEQIKQKEQNLIEDITKYSENLQNQAELCMN